MALKQTKSLRPDERLEAINKLLHGYGIEAIEGSWQNGYWCNIVANYVNMGDTYSTTILFIRDNYGNSGRFSVMCWGDFVERYGKKYGIE